MFERLLGAGLAVAAPDYRLTAEAALPCARHDLTAAVRYLRHYATQLRLDTDRIGVWGDSAGAHLALAGLAGARAYPRPVAAGRGRRRRRTHRRPGHRLLVWRVRPDGAPDLQTFSGRMPTRTTAPISPAAAPRRLPAPRLAAAAGHARRPRHNGPRRSGRSSQTGGRCRRRGVRSWSSSPVPSTSSPAPPSSPQWDHAIAFPDQPADLSRPPQTGHPVNEFCVRRCGPLCFSTSSTVRAGLAWRTGDPTDRVPIVSAVQDSALSRRQHGFESRWDTRALLKPRPVAQLVSAPPCHGGRSAGSSPGSGSPVERAASAPQTPPVPSPGVDGTSGTFVQSR